MIARSPVRYRTNGIAKLSRRVMTTSPNSPADTCRPSLTISTRTFSALMCRPFLSVHSCATNLGRARRTGCTPAP